jgi:hypothetical protein
MVAVTTPIPTTRTQVWLARGAGAACLVLLLIMIVFRSHVMNVTRLQKGNTTVYYCEPLLSALILGTFGIVIGVMAVVYWMQPGFFFRSKSIVLAALAIMTLVMIPGGFGHRVTVTPDYLCERIGRFSPTETRVDFGSLIYVTVERTNTGSPRHPNYEIQFFPRKGDKTCIRVNDLMKKALPEVLNKASQHGAIIGEVADGAIPAGPRE